MKVELRDHIGQCVKSKREIKIQQWRVFVDGRAVGYLPWRDGSKLLLTARFSPLETKEIEQHVNELVKTVREKDVQSVSAPEVPPEIMDPELMEEGFEHGDFD